MEDLKIKIIRKIEKEKIIELYKDAGWWDKNDEKDSSLIKKIIKGSYIFVGAFLNNRLVGIGRVLSDGVSDAYIQDVVVSKDYRKQGIGSKIVEFILIYLKSKKINWIALIGEPGTENFYKKLGFEKMEKYVPYKYSQIKYL
ncbi:MAG: GNAT family N-acetyltransferase [Spirochaetes bacterium]|nr:GNAT family N-acetyltransferase [Spirochaetota bacterium]